MVNVGKYTSPMDAMGYGYSYGKKHGVSVNSSSPQWKSAALLFEKNLVSIEMFVSNVDVMQYSMIVQQEILLHQGKSTWHRSYVLVYISPVLTYLLGSVPRISTLRYIKTHNICITVTWHMILKVV